MVDTSKLEKLMHSREWNEPMLAGNLSIDYSYLYRVLRNERNPGGKLFYGLARLCKSEGLNIMIFLKLD